MTTPRALYLVPGAGDTTDPGPVSARVLRQAFPQWQVFECDGTWWAARGGLQEWAGPRSLIQRVLRSADLAVLAEKLCVQEWLAGMNDEELTEVYHSVRAADVT